MGLRLETWGSRRSPATILFANVTRLSRKARQFLEEDDSALLLLAEHHVPQEHLTGVCRSTYQFDGSRLVHLALPWLLDLECCRRDLTLVHPSEDSRELRPPAEGVLANDSEHSGFEIDGGRSRKNSRCKVGSKPIKSVSPSA